MIRIARKITAAGLVCMLVFGTAGTAMADDLTLPEEIAAAEENQTQGKDGEQTETTEAQEEDAEQAEANQVQEEIPVQEEDIEQDEERKAQEESPEQTEETENQGEVLDWADFEDPEGEEDIDEDDGEDIIGLEVDDRVGDHYTKYGGTCKLKIYVTANNMSKVTYEWYCAGELMEGQNTDTITTNPVYKNTVYTCVVREGFFKKSMDFLVQVSNSFELFRKGSYRQYLLKGSSIKLSVTASGDNTDNITYQWYVRDANNKETALDGAVYSSYMTGAIHEETSYSCVATDTYGNTAWAGFIVSPVPDGYAKITAGEVNTFEIIPDDPDESPEEQGDRFCTFTPPASGKYVFYSNATAKELIIYDKNMKEICRAEEDGNLVCSLKAKQLYYVQFLPWQFTVKIKVTFYNNFSLEYDNSEITAAIGDTVDLKVTPRGNNIEGVRYQWYKRDNGETSLTELKGAVSDHYTTEPIQKSGIYACKAVDQYGNEYGAGFQINADNQFKATVTGTKVFYYSYIVDPGEDIELSMKVSGMVTEGVTYQWRQYREDQNSETGYSFCDIENYSENTLLLKGVTKYTYCTCTATDLFGNTASVGIEVYVSDRVKSIKLNQETALKLSPRDQIQIYSYKPGTSAYYAFSNLKDSDDYILALFDQNWKRMDISYSIDDGKGVVRGYLKAGKKYYFRVECDTDNDSDTYNLKLVKLKAVSNAAVTADDQTYTGSKLKPVPTVKLGSRTLKAGRDYTVKYSSNKNAGTAKITVTGIGKYGGTATGTFTIKKAKNTFTKVTSAKKIAYSKLKQAKQTFTIAATVKEGAEKTYVLSSVPNAAKKYITVSKAGKVTVKKGLAAGTYKIKVKITAAKTANYRTSTVTKIITIKVA